MMKTEMDRRRLCLALTGIAMTASARAEGAAKAGVMIDNFTFTPERLNVKPGTIVTWMNHDDIPHSIVAVKGKFRSRALDTDDVYSFTFEETGDYDYYCGLHPHMKGTIVVKA